jgi:predicted RNA-binding protein with TRAM domain
MLDWVVYDVYDYVLGWVNVDGITFVTETEEGEYVQFDVKDVNEVMNRIEEGL